MNEALARGLEATALAAEAITTLQRDRAFEVHAKGGSEIVTSADLRSDALIRAHLGRAFPSHRFLSEEVAVDAGFNLAGPVWVIDPIDGTTNYAHRHPYVAISVALVIDGEVGVGIVHAPFLNETYTAVRGQGAWCNGQPLRASSVVDLRRALVGTCFPHDRADLSVAMERVRRLLTHCQDIRRAGSPALEICWVASGRLDAHCESLAPWDVAAAGLIAREAGALRANLVETTGRWPVELCGEEVLFAAPGIFDELKALFLLR